MLRGGGGLRKRTVRASAPPYDNVPFQPLDELATEYIAVQVGHAVAALIHAVSFIVLLALRSNVSKSEGVLTSELFVRGNATSDYECSLKAGVGVKALEGYPLVDVLLPMPALTAFFHVIQFLLMTFPGSSLSRWYINEVYEKRNLIRWIEYSITASLMTWIVCQLSGMTNIYLVWTVGIVMNIAMQIQGYMWELFQKQSIRWIPFITGSILFIGQWTLILCYFWRAVNAAGDDVPPFVRVIIWGLLGSFLLFPALQLFINRLPWFWYEMGFIVLSAVSKLLLDWTLYGGIANQ